MDALTFTIAAAIVAFAAFVVPAEGKPCAKLRRLPRLPRVRGHRGDHRDVVSEDLRRSIEAATIPHLY
jgi:hypothetical protein